MRTYANNQLVAKLGMLRGCLEYDRQAIRRSRKFDHPKVVWSFWMNEAKEDKKALRREAVSLHWYLYLSGKTDVRPAVDMPMTDMNPEHSEALMAHYRRAMREARIAVQAG